MSIRQTKRQERLASIVENELARAEARDAQDVGANRERALAMYRGVPVTGDDDRANNGLSTVHSMDLADMVQACLAQITPMLTTDCVVQFEPEGQEDEDSARAESAAVDHVIQAENPGYRVFHEAFFDALLLRNGWVKVYVDEDERTRTIPLEGNESAEALAMLMLPSAPNEYRELTDNSVIVTTRTNHFRISAVPSENMTYEANADSADLDSLRFIAERQLKTRSELVEMGFPKSQIWKLTETHDEDNLQSRNRNKSAEITGVAESKDQDLIECHEAYIRVDLNNDGIAELYRAYIAEDYCLDYEEVEQVPYATGSPFLSPHRITGESLYDRLRMTQETKTLLTRYMLDNAKNYTYGKWVADEAQTNIEDILNGSPVVRSQRPEAGVIPIPQPDFSGQLLGQLQYQDKVRTERGGASLDMQKAEMQVAGETAHGIERQVSLREMLTAMMARNLAETLVRRAYRLMHDYIRLYSNEPLEMKLNGEWQVVDPASWRRRTRLNVKAGLSMGEKMRKQQALAQVIQMQISAIENGFQDVITDDTSLYNAMQDWAMASDLDNPDSYLVSPNSQQAQQAKQQRAQQTQQQQNMQLQLAAMQAQQLQQAEQIKQQAEMLKHSEDLQFKYWEARLKTEADEAKTVAQGITDLNKTQLQGEQRERQLQNGAERSAASDRGTTE